MLTTEEVLKKARSLTSVQLPKYDGDDPLKHGWRDHVDKNQTLTVAPRNSPPPIADSALECIGYTPMIRLTRFARHYGLKCDLVAKCEFMSVGGSVKDRIGKRMVEDAERQGRLSKGAVLVEPTSGNTGIGLALTAAIKGYGLVITLPEKMSQEKMSMLELLGAEVVRTPTECAWNDIESNIGLAMQLEKTIDNAHVLDQYTNPANPLSHYDGTGAEILAQCEGKVDMAVFTTGTGGTITGAGQKLKDALPNCKIVGVDPHGSILARPDSLNGEAGKSYTVEGIGYDFIPDVLDRDVVDVWLKSNDHTSYVLARQLARLEGLLVGGSSGSALQGVLEAAKDLREDQRCVVLLADSVRNYMTKFVDDRWMRARRFIAPIKTPPGSRWAGLTVTNVLPTLTTPTCIGPLISLQDVLPLFTKHPENCSDEIVVVFSTDDEATKKCGSILGVLTSQVALKALSSLGGASKLVKQVVQPAIERVDRDSELHQVSEILQRESFVLVTEELRKNSRLLGVLKQRDLLAALN